MNLAAMDKQIRELTKVTQGLARMKIEGFDRHSTGGHVSFVPRPGTDVPYYDRFVVVVRDPVATDGTLLVREVRYTDPYPKPCTSADPSVCRYEWAGDSFEAFPLFGFSVMAYGDSFQAPTDTLTDKTAIHRCTRNHGSWIVEPRPVAEGGGVRPARIPTLRLDGTANAVGTAASLTVQPVKRQGASWVTDGPAIDVAIWGGQQGQDFATLVQNGPDATADYIPLIQHEGEWYAMQYFWLYAKTPNASITKGDCGL